MKYVLNDFFSFFMSEIDLSETEFTHSTCELFAKNITRRTTSDKVPRDKAFKIASSSKSDEYRRGIASVVFKFFDEKSKGWGAVRDETATIQLINN